jgi:hypothetical protein
MAGRRIADLGSFYSILDRLEQRLGGAKTLGDCSGRFPWPQRGVYFFFEGGENRNDSGIGPRVVRVGTHSLTSSSRTNLWTRLSQHRGQAGSGGGNHRGSIFRLIVGAALISRDQHACVSWGKDSSAAREIREQEIELERAVSAVIRAMPFLWLAIGDEPGAGSLRGYIERNAIALLSNFDRTPADTPSFGWLGHHSNRERVRKSGLWNSNHVDESSTRFSGLERLADDGAAHDRRDPMRRDQAGRCRILSGYAEQARSVCDEPFQGPAV